MERTLTVRLRALIGDYQAALTRARGDTSAAASSINRDLKSIGADASKVGGQLSRGLTLPLVGLGAGATKLSLDFDTTFTRMTTLAGVSASAIGGLKDDILELSATTGRGPQELAEALYFASSAGYDTATALDIVTSAAKASAVGLGTTQAVTDAVTNALGAYGTANLTAAEATDVLLASARIAKVEASQIAPQLGRLLPLANQLGIGFDEVGASLAYLTQSNGDASLSATMLQGVLQRLLVPTEAGNQALARYGLSLDDVKRAIANGGLPAGLDLLKRKLGDNSTALQAVFSDIQGYTGAVQLLEDTNGNLTVAFASTADSAGEVSKAFDTVSKTDAMKMRQALSEISGAVIALGAVIAPVVAQVAGIVGPIVAVFSTLPPWVQKGVAGFLLLLAVMGPVMRMGGALITNFALLRSVGAKALDALAVGAYNAAGAMSALTVAAGIAALAVAGLALYINESNNAAKEAHERQKAFADSLRETGDAATSVSLGLTEALKSEDWFAAAFAKAGVTVDQVSAAVVAGGQAFEDMKKRILDNAKAAGANSLQIGLLKSVLSNLPKDLAAAEKHNADLNTVQAKTAPTAKAAGTALADLGIDVNNLAATTAGAVSGLAKLLAGIDSLFAGTIGVTRASEDFDDALADIDSSTASTGGSTRNLERDQRTLEKATKDVTSAQEDLAAAEKALAEARKGPSARELKDAGLNVKDADLGLAEAKRRVRDAQKSLSEERKKGREGDVAGATLALKRAQLELERAELRAADSRKELNDVQKSGLETSEKVKSAVADVADAHDRLEEAEQRVKDVEADLRGEASSGGPLADRQRKIRDSIDKTIDSGKNWIDTLFKTKAPESEIRAAIDKQVGVVDALAEKYGDADGKLAAWKKTLQETKAILDGFVILYIDGEPILIPRTGGLGPIRGPSSPTDKEGSGGGGTMPGPGQGTGPAGPQGPGTSTPPTTAPPTRSGGGDIFPDFSVSAAMAPPTIPPPPAKAPATIPPKAAIAPAAATAPATIAPPAARAPDSIAPAAATAPATIAPKAVELPPLEAPATPDLIPPAAAMAPPTIAPKAAEAPPTKAPAAPPPVSITVVDPEPAVAPPSIPPPPVNPPPAVAPATLAPAAAVAPPTIAPAPVKAPAPEPMTSLELLRVRDLEPTPAPASSTAMAPASALGQLYAAPTSPLAPAFAGRPIRLTVELGGRAVLQTVIDQADLEGGAPILIKASR